MRIIKIVCVTINCLMAVTSCTDVDDYYYNEKKPPQIYVSIYGKEVSNDDNYRDTIKRMVNYPITYRVVDQERPNGKIRVQLAGETIYNFAFSDIPQEKKYIISASEVGLKKLLLMATDEYGKKGFCQLELVVIDNMDPVAKFNVKVIGDREIEVDASESYDRDERMGGKVVKYIYNLNGYEFESSSNYARYKFTTGGNKVIKVRVVDSDGEVSEETTTIINL